MSQHYFRTTYENRPVTVVVGYDRPLRGFFCFVERADGAATDDTDEFVYSNLDDPKLAASMGFSKSVDYFKRRLADLGLVVPASMFIESERDRLGNVGNRQAWHEANGAFA